MRCHVLAAMMLVAAAGPAAAQGRVTGEVKDDRGDPVRGAIVVAENIEASPSSFTASTDNRGRFAVIGLKSGIWTFRAGAPGYTSDGGDLNVRAGNNPQLRFTLEKLVVAPSALGSQSPKELQTALSNADKLYEAGQWDAAIAAYKSILDRSPSLSVINLQIAAAYRQKKAWDDAVKAYNSLLSTDPDNNKAKIGIAMTNFEKGDLEAAERTLEAAAAAGATRETFYDLGDIRMARSQVDAAAEAYERAAQLDPTWGKPALALGKIAMDRGDREGARKYLQTVVDVAPVSPEAAEAKTMLAGLDESR